MIKHSLQDRGGNWNKFRVQKPTARNLVYKGILSTRGRETSHLF